MSCVRAELTNLDAGLRRYTFVDETDIMLDFSRFQQTLYGDIFPSETENVRENVKVEDGFANLNDNQATASVSTS